MIVKTLRQFGRRAPSLTSRQMKLTFWLLCTALALLEITASWNTALGTDGVSYLDMADAWLRADWTAAINGYWSPLYPWLLGCGIWLLKPASYNDQAITLLVNLSIFFATLVTFEFFLTALVKEASHTTLPEWALRGLAAAVFLWVVFKLITLRLGSPDLLVGCLVNLANGIVLRLRQTPQRFTLFLWLGLTLGLGYLAKAIMFPLAFFFLLAALSLVRPWQRSLVGVGLSSVVFLLLAGPWIGLLSAHYGHFTYGEVSRLSYIWRVNGLADRHWQNDQPEFGHPWHPTRVIHQQPSAYEFSAPVGGSYPPWYDAAYWYQGVQMHFQLDRQIVALGRNLADLFHLLLGLPLVLLGSWLVLARQSAQFKSWRALFGSTWPLLLPSLAAIGVYSLVSILPRYLAPFFIVLFILPFAGIQVRQARWLKGVLASVILVAGFSILRPMRQQLITLIQNPRPVASDVKVAQGLQHWGLPPGTPVAVTFGAAGNGKWARRAQVRIIAEVDTYQPELFWQLAPATQASLLEAFAATGAKLLVAPQVPTWAKPDGWQKLAETDYFVCPLQK